MLTNKLSNLNNWLRSKIQGPLYFSCLFSLIVGTLYTLGFPSLLVNPGHPLFSILGVGLFFWMLRVRLEKKFSIKEIIFFVGIFCLTVNYLGFYWIPYTIQTFGGVPAPVAYVIGGLIFPIIFPHVWTILLVILALRKFAPKVLKALLTEPKWFFGTAFLITALEYLTPHQFPTQIGMGWLSQKSALGMGPIFGSPFYSFISFWIAILFSSQLFSQKIELKKWIPHLILLIACVGLTPYSINSSTNQSSTDDSLGDKNRNLNQNQSSSQNEQQRFNIRFVQANIGSYFKVAAEKGRDTAMRYVLSRFRKLAESPSGRELDLIIWPETAYPVDLNSEKLLNKKIKVDRYIQSILDAHPNTQLLIGGYDIGFLNRSLNRDQTVYNTAFLFEKDEGLINKYHKSLLIPFGETLPFGPLNESLKPYIPGVSYFSKGDGFTIFDFKKSATALMAICYEILDFEFIRSRLNRFFAERKENPKYLFNLTNDSWYGDTIEPHQHLFMASWRAVEFQIPIIRSTNTGITTVVSPDGTYGQSLGVGEFANLDISLPVVQTHPTLFQFGGWWNLVGLQIIFLLTQIIRRTLFHES